MGRGGGGGHGRWGGGEDTHTEHSLRPGTQRTFFLVCPAYPTPPFYPIPPVCLGLAYSTFPFCSVSSVCSVCPRFCTCTTAPTGGRGSRLCTCPRGLVGEDQHAWDRRAHLCHALHHVTQHPLNPPTIPPSYHPTIHHSPFNHKRSHDTRLTAAATQCWT